MSEKHHRRRVRLWIGAVIASTAIVAGAVGETEDGQPIGQGEVTANNVYVRSGNSINHYPVCRLQAGARVTIVGQQGEWYEVLPPEGTFSWVSAQYVDSVDHVQGVVNGHNVRVRAGSALDDYKSRRDVVQTKLSKGAEVSIVGTSPDGFLRIVPPAGVTTWISRQYVAAVPNELVEAERALDETAEITAESPDEKATASEGAVSPFAELSPGEERQRLERLDAEARAELSKPMLKRDLTSVIEQYRVIAGQDGDVFAQRYATRRVEQITHMQKLIEALRSLRQLGNEAEAVRRKAFEDRASIPRVVPPPPSGLDAQGELRVSALYPPGSHPRRYRLVDRRGADERTIGYVEIPADSPLEVGAYIGRYVGVRAASSRLQVGGVNPVPIYVATELVLLQPAAGDADSPRPGEQG